MVLGFALASAGCSYVTGEAQQKKIAHKNLKFITLHQTTKQEVLLRLGEPARVWHGETRFLYADYAKVVTVGPDLGVPENLFLILIEFDDQRRVNKFEVKRKYLPGTNSSWSLRYLHRRALLDILSRWMNQVVSSS